MQLLGAFKQPIVRERDDMKESNTLPYVRAFAERMEAKLAQNRHKGDREGWMSCSPEWLFARLVNEIGEVAQIMAMDPQERHAAGIVDELADVANFCMMLADRIEAE